MDKKREDQLKEHKAKDIEAKESLELCPHPADPESARAEDEDGPCDDGVR